MDGTEHIWGTHFGMPCCDVCGIVQRADGKNKPCRGPMRLRPMEKSSPLKGKNDKPIERLAKEIGASYDPKHETTDFAIGWTKALAQIVGQHAWPVLHKYPEDVRAWANQIVNAPPVFEAFTYVCESVRTEIHSIDFDDGWATDRAGSALESVCLAMLPGTRWLANASQHVWKFAVGTGSYNDIVRFSQNAWLCHLYGKVAATSAALPRSL